LQTRIITSLFEAIASKNTEVVHLLISQGFVSPDVTSSIGCTPLIAAIIAGNGTMVCTLVALGATVNSYGRDDAGRERTPLMVAAQQGRLPLVKLLVEDFNADDAVIAPDGQLALRLAADAGHREVVAYLPLRRGGEWRRWKAHHAVMVRRIRKAGVNLYKFVRFFVWDLPRFFVWSCPKHLVVKPLGKMGRYCWENKGRFGGWCKRQVKEMPGRVKRGAEKVGRGLKKVPKGVWRVVKAVPRVVADVMKAIWRVIKRIPAAMKVVGVWVWESLKKVGLAVGDVFLKVVSAIHTAVMAVLEFFRKTTLRDVWNGICDVFEAVFVTLPKTIWRGIKAAGDMTLKVLEGMFGCVGALIWYFFKGLLWVAKFIPTQLWKIICSIGSSMAKGYHEMRVWFNPK
ncbi:ankyrin repeat-containing domain protein, partial [Cercophora newfieldiana]